MSDLQDKIIGLLEDRKLRVEREFGSTTIDPFTLEPGWSVPDPFPPGCSDSDITAFEDGMGIRLSPDFCQWLRISNGASGFFGISPTSGGNKVEEALARFPEWKSWRWIPVEYDAFGNYFVKVIGDDAEGTGPVCFVESLEPNRLVHAVASDVLHFVEFSLEESQTLNQDMKYGWPYDEKFALSKDPELTNVSMVPLPWANAENV